jgi:hypothetical protein
VWTGFKRLRVVGFVASFCENCDEAFNSLKVVEFLDSYQLLKNDCPIEIVLKCTGLYKMAVFWVVAPCSLIEVYQRFRGPCCLHYQGRENLKSY